MRMRKKLYVVAFLPYLTHLSILILFRSKLRGNAIFPIIKIRFTICGYNARNVYGFLFYTSNKYEE